MKSKTKVLTSVLLCCALVLAFTACAGCTEIENMFGSVTKEEDFTPVDYIVGVWTEPHDLKTSSSYTEYRIYGDYTFKKTDYWRNSNGWSSGSAYGIWSGPKSYFTDKNLNKLRGNPEFYTLTYDNAGMFQIYVNSEDKEKNVIHPYSQYQTSFYRS